MKTKPSWRRRELVRQEVEDLITLAMSLGYVFNLKLKTYCQEPRPGYDD